MIYYFVWLYPFSVCNAAGDNYRFEAKAGFVQVNNVAELEKAAVTHGCKLAGKVVVSV